MRSTRFERAERRARSPTPFGDEATALRRGHVVPPQGILSVMSEVPIGASASAKSIDSRLEALLSMVEADPSDLTARMLLGVECLSVGRAAEAAQHLTFYVQEFEGDKGAACLSLARARQALGDRAGALDAVARGIENAAAHRHLQLAAALEAERDGLGAD